MTYAPALLFTLTLAAASAAGAQEKMIAPQQAPHFAGKSGMVCGRVEKARFAQNSEGEPTFLYMGGEFPRHTFSARIWGEDRGKFRPAPDELEGKDVCVIGEIKRDGSRAEIVVRSPSDLKLAIIK